MDWKRQLKNAIDGEAIAKSSGLFGVDIPGEAAGIVLIPVPWEGTVSYGKGTGAGPHAIRLASHQMDFFDLDFEVPLAVGIATDPLSSGTRYCDSSHVASVNYSSLLLNRAVSAKAGQWLDCSKVVGVVGGEHSAPFGLIEALGERETDFGILHIDAHHDLRPAYEGYEYSHASIMYNVLHHVPTVSTVVSVGIRDFSAEEKRIAESFGSRVRTFYDQQTQQEKLGGRNWCEIASEIVRCLPQRVYVSFDIDGLDPSLCPSTGTPVPGGLNYYEAMFLLAELARQRKRILGFDLCEVAPGQDQWDANVGARILYKLCGVAAQANALKRLI